MELKGLLGMTGAVALATLMLGSYAPNSRAEDPAPTKDKVAAKPKAVPAKKPPTPANDADAPLVFTNADLEHMFGPSEAKPPESEATGEGEQKAEGEKAAKDAKPGTGEEKWDPLKAMEEEKAKAAEQAAKVAVAEKAVADAEANLRSLESQLLATKNPYLARPQLTPDEQKALEGMDNAQRVDRNEQQIQDARAQVEKLRGELDKARSTR